MPATTTRTTASRFAEDLAKVLNKLDRDGKPIAHVYIPPREADQKPPSTNTSAK